MSYEILWDKKALDSLKEIDKPMRKRIFDKVNDFVLKDPVNLGKPLKENMSGLYRYRFGDYRVIYSVDLEKRLMTVLAAGHRKSIYGD